MDASRPEQALHIVSIQPRVQLRRGRGATRFEESSASSAPTTMPHPTPTVSFALSRDKLRVKSQVKSATAMASPRLLALGLFVVLAMAATTTSALVRAPTQRRLAATLADAPSLRLRFTLKRSSMKIFGQLEFDVFANPVVSNDNTTVRYDGVATFNDGDTKHTFVLVDGIAYFVTSSDGSVTAECSSSSSLQLLNAILPALNDATAISSAEVDENEITCPSGGLFKVVLGDATFVLCTSGSAGIVVYGSDLEIHVKYLDTRVPITAPTLSDEEARSCETMVEPCAVTATTLSLLTGEPVVNDRVTRSLKHYLGHFLSYAR